MTNRYICNICELGRLVSLEKKLNVGGSHVDMYICDYCFVINNFSKQNQNLELQEKGLIEFYKYTEEDIKNIPENIELCKGIINPILPFIPHYKDKIMLEVGCGKGLLLLAASELGFKKVIGLDLNLTLFAETRKYFNVKGDVCMYRNIDDVKDRVDCVVMWHTLEHVFDPNIFLRDLVPKMNEDCILYFQVPQYYQPYICDTHHYFYNEPSISALMERNGFKIIKIDYDTTNQFITVVAIRDSTLGIPGDTRREYIDYLIKTKDDHIRDLKAIIKDRDILIDSMRKTTERTDDHIRDLKAIIKDRDMQIDSINKTLRWRVYERLRRVRDLFFRPGI